MAEETVAPIVVEDRKSVIAAAVAAADKESETAPPVVEETKEEKKEEKKVETKAEPTEDEVLAQQGRDLMLALKDPQKGLAVAKYLADAFGLNKVPETKTEVKEITNETLEALKEGLGEEFSVIADRLAPAIEKILIKKMETATADIRANIQAQEVEKLEAQSSAALTKISTDYFGEAEPPPAVAAEMSKFMDKFSPDKTMTVKEYLQDAFDHAVGKLGLPKTTKAERAAAEAKQERTNKNHNDAPNRLASERAPSPESLRTDSKPMGRKEAIEAAILAVDKG